MKSRAFTTDSWIGAKQFLPFLDELPVALFCCDHFGVIEYANSAALDLFQREINGMEAADLFHSSGPAYPEWGQLLREATTKASNDVGLIPVIIRTSGKGTREIVCKLAYSARRRRFTCVLLSGVHGMLAALARIAESAVHAFHVDETFREVATEARSLTGADRCYIVCQASDGTQVLRAVCSRDQAENVTEFALPKIAGLITLALHHRCIESSRDLIAEPPERRYSPFSHTVSQVVVPLAAGDRASSDRAGEALFHGVLVAESDDQLGWEVESILETVAIHGAIAIAHALLLIEVSSTYDDIVKELRSVPELSIVQNLVHDAKNLVRDTCETVENLQAELADSPFAKRKAAELANSTDTLNDIKDLLGDMLTKFRNPQNRQSPLGNGTLELGTIVRKVRRILRGSAAGQVEIVIVDDKHRSYPVYGEQGKLLMVLYNLMANSVSAVKSSGRAGKIAVSLSDTPKQPGYVRVEIADTGPGMPRAIRALVHKGEGVTRTIGGSGLGLITVREMIKDLRGSISVDTHLGEGTRITIDLPGMEASKKK